MKYRHPWEWCCSNIWMCIYGYDITLCKIHVYISMFCILNIIWIICINIMYTYILYCLKICIISIHKRIHISTDDMSEIIQLPIHLPCVYWLSQGSQWLRLQWTMKFHELPVFPWALDEELSVFSIGISPFKIKYHNLEYVQKHNRGTNISTVQNKSQQEILLCFHMQSSGCPNDWSQRFQTIRVSTSSTVWLYYHEATQFSTLIQCSWNRNPNAMEHYWTTRVTSLGSRVTSLGSNLYTMEIGLESNYNKLYTMFPNPNFCDHQPSPHHPKPTWNLQVGGFIDNISLSLGGIFSWLVLSDEQMSNKWHDHFPTKLRANEQQGGGWAPTSQVPMLVSRFPCWFPGFFFPPKQFFPPAPFEGTQGQLCPSWAAKHSLGEVVGWVVRMVFFFLRPPVTSYKILYPLVI